MELYECIYCGYNKKRYAAHCGSLQCEKAKQTEWAEITAHAQSESSRLTDLGLMFNESSMIYGQ